MAGLRRVVINVDESLLLAVNETAERLYLTPEQFIVKAVKERLSVLGVTWWQSLLEVNTPKGVNV